MYKYLLAVDGSDNSLRAAHYLKRIAAGHKKVSVTVLSVQETAAWFTESADEVIKNITAVFQESGIDVHSEVIEGDPGEVIAGAAGAMGADHIVMGARGLGAAKGLFLGSVSQKVIELTERPVTIIK